MIDVKDLTDAIRQIWYVSVLVVVGGLGYLLSGAERRKTGYRAIFHGGIATVSILLVIAGLILLGWSFFFVQFHELLFPPGTWTFSYSDSLIRLFPEQFWFDVGVIISVGALLLGVVATAVGYLLNRRA
jgi:integral membrane protein (TIGR01906 family)